MISLLELRELKVRVEGQLVVNNLALRLKSAIAGLGIAYLPEDQVRTHVAEGQLLQVLDDWCPPFSSYEPQATHARVRLAGRYPALPETLSGFIPIFSILPTWHL
jgi:DNA-binding transcriptional LysR family regulator